MSHPNISVTFHGLLRGDASNLVRTGHKVIGEYWSRKVIVDPPSTDWVVEARAFENSQNWIHMYGPWDQRNVFMFVEYWNSQCGWIKFRAMPVMTEEADR